MLRLIVGMVVSSLLVIAGLVILALGRAQGKEMRACAPHTEDGRPLIAIYLQEESCRYSPLPVGEPMSPIELRRLARVRERQLREK